MEKMEGAQGIISVYGSFVGRIEGFVLPRGWFPKVSFFLNAAVCGSLDAFHLFIRFLL
jgi:hypothetical protein